MLNTKATRGTGVNAKFTCTASTRRLDVDRYVLRNPLIGHCQGAALYTGIVCNIPNSFKGYCIRLFALNICQGKYPRSLLIGFIRV
ncbi:hypothetical protein IAD21_04423 [Abditibacteriota bacterium]|nr:hypothetical protein IAD21_04423 [Abditibacteriota bacterium]